MVTCSCREGFDLDHDGRSCQPINACDKQFNICSDHCIQLPTQRIIMSPDTAVHIAAPGVYFRCECPNGMELKDDKKTCQCLEGLTLKNGRCLKTSTDNNRSALRSFSLVKCEFLFKLFLVIFFS